MPDRVNDELLSAYLDNEVTDEERATVQRALADSPEMRMSFESLRQVQARLRAIPRLTLADDFHERVLREAKRRSVDQSVTPVTVRSAHMAKWIRISVVAATVAAVMVIAVIVINRNETGIVENPNPDRPDVVHSPLPGPDVIASHRAPEQVILVLDVAITKQGQEEDAFGSVLRQAGFSWDPRSSKVQLEKDLQYDLLATRFVAGVNQPDESMVIEHFDVVDMIYLRGTNAQIDFIHPNMVAHPEIRAVLDVAIKPRASKILNSVGERSWSLARSKSTLTGSPGSFAYRLNIGVTLHSSPSGFLAKFGTPVISARLVPIDKKPGVSVSGITLPIPSDLVANKPQQEKADGETTMREDLQVNEILVIRRNLNGSFAR